MLVDHGATILGRNVEIERGEIDIHAIFGRTVVAVEVKTLASDSVMANPLKLSFPTTSWQQTWSKGRRTKFRQLPVQETGRVLR